MKALKWTGIVVGVLVMLVAVVLLGLHGLAKSSCETEISESVPSPDKLIEAVVFTTGCGVTDSSARSFLMLRKSGDQKDLDDSDAIFAIDDYGVLPSERYANQSPKLALSWESDKDLKVGYPKGPHVLKTQAVVMGVSLRFQQPAETPAAN